MHMKKFLTSVFALLLGAYAASAQYLCSDKGTVFVFSETAKDDNDKDVTSEYTCTVSDVTTDDNGVVTSVFETVHKVPGKEFAEIKSTSTYSYNPADKVTNYVMMTGQEFVDVIIKTIADAAAEEGQYISPEQLEEAKKQIRVKGELSMPLPDVIDPAVKVPNKTIKLSMGPNTLSSSLWDIKYAGIEDVTVPAGTYKDCIKVNYISKQTSPAGTIKNNCTSWFAKGVGEVKCENYDKKGNVVLSQELQSVKK